MAQELYTSHRTEPVDFTKPIDTSKLKDKSVMVTGGANGIGLASVEAPAEAGAYVTILDINEEKGNAAVEASKKKGQHVQFVKTDTTSWTAQVAGFKAAVSFSPSGTVDLVLASAGLTGENASSWLKKAMPSSSSGQDPSAPISPSIDVNLKAVYYTTHLAIYYFKKTLPEEKSVNLDKHLSFMSSAAGYIAMNNATDYNASKFGVRGLWKAIRHSNTILGHNATSRTNLIAPTWIATSMTEYMWSALRKSGIEIATVGDVVASVMRAACDEEISGRAICIGPGKNTPGDSNFDLCDDWNGLDAGRVLQEKIKDGTFGGMKG